MISTFKTLVANVKKTHLAIGAAVLAGLLSAAFLFAEHSRISARERSLALSEKNSSEAGGGVVGKIPAGQRAVAVAVNGVTGVAGLIRPKDTVDVMATFDFGSDASSKVYTYTILEGVKVLSVNDETAGLRGLGNLSAKRTVTLALTPKAAQEIVLAQEAGNLSLSLRPDGEAPVELLLEPATPASVTGIRELVRHGPRPAYREYRGR